MNNKFYYLLILFTCILLFGISTKTESQQPVFKSFDIRTENTRPKIIKLFLDHNGLIWLGTDKGIFIFDGLNFRKINSPDTLNSYVSSFYEDKESSIWVGFENGKIINIKNQTASVFRPEGQLPKVSISAFTEDISGKLFFSTKGEGVFYVEKNKLIQINQDDGLSDDYCYFIVKLPDQRICIGTDAGLNFVKYSNGKTTVKSVGPSEGLPDDIVRTFAYCNDQSIWIGLHEKGISKFDFIKNKIVPFKLKKQWNYGQVNGILPVDDQLWVITEDKGIIIIDREGRTKKFQLDVNRNISSSDILVDFENNVWISESIHLYRTSGNKITFFNAIGNKLLKYVHCIACDRSGKIWFSPDQQLACIKLNTEGNYEYREYKILDKKIDIVTLYIDPYDYIWIGTMGAGVYRFNPVTGKAIKVTETANAESASILSINGKNDNIWVAGFNSVMKFLIRSNGYSDEAKIEKVNAFEKDQSINDYVYSVFIDSKNRPWFATDGNGVYYQENNNLINIPVPENAVHSFTEDKKGRIWFSTADAGLIYLDTDHSIKKFQTKDGLSDPSPTSLVCTKEGNIVVVHSNGFDVINPDTKNIIYHSSEENLADLNCDLNSAALASDSTIWFGTERGILQYKPSSDMRLLRPKIVLEAVSVFREPINFRQKNTFNSDENNFRFDFDGLWYTDPQRINYLFKLDGYSPKWESTKDHTVTFPKLPFGKYVFRIKSSLNGNFDQAEETSYSFVILPPIWQRWWFRLLAATAVALLIFIIVRRREKRLLKFDRLQKEKIEFQFETLKSQVNPHFLFNSFNTLISVIDERPKDGIEYVQRLSEFFRSIVTYRDKNYIRVSEELNLLDNYIFIQKKRYGENFKLEIQLDEEIRRNKYVAPLTLQLLAENAIKHNAVSKETPLLISINSENGKMVITNNINLKIAQEKSAGFGLQNIVSRYELLTNEKVEIIHSTDKFIVKIPLLNPKNEHTYS